MSVTSQKELSSSNPLVGGGSCGSPLTSVALSGSLVMLLAITAVWISCGHFQYGQNADTLVNTLLSLQHWTPYYWEADRYGMLVPLVVKPIHHPLTNMLAQTAITIFTCLSASFMLVKYFFEDSSMWLMAAAVQNVWLLVVASKAAQFDWFVLQPYGPGMALGVAGLLLLRRKRITLALVMLLLSEWVDTGAFVFLIPLVVLRHLVKREKSGFQLTLSLLGVGAAAGMLGKTFSDAPKAVTSLAPVTSWPSAWLQLLQHGWQAAFSNLALSWLIIIPLGLGLTASLFYHPRKYVFLTVASLALTAVANWIFVGTLTWVGMNHFASRYVYSSLLLIGTALAILTVSPLQALTPRQTKFMPLLGAIIIFIAGALTYGAPSRARVEHDLDAKFGAITPEVISSHATLISGNYWSVWPAVFHANLTLYKRNEHRMIYGVTYRDKPTMTLWSHSPCLLAAAPKGDPEAMFWLTNSPKQFTHLRTLSTIELYGEHCPRTGGESR